MAGSVAAVVIALASPSLSSLERHERRPEATAPSRLLAGWDAHCLAVRVSHVEAASFLYCKQNSEKVRKNNNNNNNNNTNKGFQAAKLSRIPTDRGIVSGRGRRHHSRRGQTALRSSRTRRCSLKRSCAAPFDHVLAPMMHRR
jgi:hypothetical protein